MKETELKPYDDNEKIKVQANNYIERILLGTSFYERHGQSGEPTVFMSMDIMAIIARGSERALIQNASPLGAITVCGYNVKTVMEKNVLSVGFDLL